MKPFSLLLRYFRQLGFVAKWTIIFVSIFAIFEGFIYVRDLYKEKEVYVLLYKPHLNVHANSLAFYLEKNEVEKCMEAMKVMIDTNLINFGLIAKEGKIIYSNKPPLSINDLNKFKRSEVVCTTKSCYKMIDVNGFTLVAGIPDDFWLFIKSSINLDIKDYLIDVLVTAAIGLIILSILFLSFIKFAFTLGDRKRDFSKIETNTKEAEILKTGFISYEKNNEIRNEYLNILKQQILSGPEYETLSGKKPPYDFDCTMVGFDLNNFSFIFKHFDKPKFIRVAQEFFSEADLIISNYRGLIYKTVGDELLFYFKDEDHRNSCALALSAARDIDHLAKYISSKYENELGYKFGLKFGVAHGSVRLDYMVRKNLDFWAENIIKASRILGEVDKKNQYNICYDKAVAQKSKPVIESIYLKNSVLKGDDEQTELYAYKNHLDLNQILKNLKDEDIQYLYYFRKNEEIIQVLNYIRNNLNNLEKEIFLKITNVFKRFRMTNTTPELIIEYKNLIRKIEESLQHTKNPNFSFYLSSALMMSINLISKDAYNEDLKNVFRKYLKYEDNRVIANVLDVFVYFDVTNEIDELKDFDFKSHNRILANLLVKEGIKSYSKKVHNTLKKMLKSKDLYYVASGIYALGEIAQFYKNNDLVLYSHPNKLSLLLDMIPNFFSHENIMVARQALLVAKKVNESKFHDKIMELYNSTISKEIQKRIDEIYLDKIKKAA